ncbi:MAG: cobyric acid synthase [Chloroflexota bacterium]|nr:cobyric acid synthase [Chloroflexota bacterium]
MKLARCVMVQGTASSVGKSVVATALCRVLADDGWRVAPFKAQNMSLNAAVTPDGAEIGRAQAAQAAAARVAPRAVMNPILLKPERDDRSQLVVLGRATGSAATRDHWRGRTRLWPVVRSSLRALRREHEVVVIEGAGSPAELNLRRFDIANMRVAAEARAAVILVGDIERGGIFAQLLGTIDLLPAADRRRVCALLVNKLRGDRSLFEGGVRILRERSGLPVHVLPYAPDLGVPAEDSAALVAASDGNGPEIAVVAYPHMSNHDDFEPLAAAGARVRYVRRAAELDDPDLVVLPGSKTTRSDLAWLRARGLDARIATLAARGTPTLGICGGLQMLGRQLRDPDGVEGRPGADDGLGLLPVRTTLERRKRTFQVRGRIGAAGLGLSAGLPFDAYEIHVGSTRRDGARPFAQLTRTPGGRRVLDGAMGASGTVVGTYAHGLFANDELRVALLAYLARRRGRDFAPRPLPADPYVAVAAWLRASIDVPALLESCGIAR